MQTFDKQQKLTLILVGKNDYQKIIGVKIQKYLRWKDISVQYIIAKSNEQLSQIEQKEQVTIINSVELMDNIAELERQIIQISLEREIMTVEIEMELEQTAQKVVLIEGKKKMMKIRGYIQTKIVMLVIELQYCSLEQKHNIYLSRHGKSQYNLDDRIGGDSALSLQGQHYAFHLNHYLQKNTHSPLLLTSYLLRAYQTATRLQLGQSNIIQMHELDEIDAGICDSISYQEMADYYPQINQERDLNKLYYRYPQGESYIDMINRLDQIIFIIESHSHQDIVIVGHQANLRCIYGYLMDVNLSNIPYLEIPLHTIIKLQKDYNSLDYNVSTHYIDVQQFIDSQNLINDQSIPI